MQKFKPGFAPILIILLIVGVISVGGFVYLKQKPLSQSVQVNPTPSPQTDTANWKTFTSKEFSIKYPPDLVQTEKSIYSFMTGKTVNAIEFSKSRTNIEKTYLDWFTLSIFIEENQNNLSSNELIQNYLIEINKKPDTSPNQTSKVVTEKINKSLRKYENENIQGTQVLLGFEQDYDLIVMTRDGKIISFLFTGDNGNKISEKAQQEINQILSTFKFIE